MSRSTELFIRCAVAVVLAVMVGGALRPQSLYAQAGSPQALADAQAACAGDVQRLCAGVPPGGGRIVACIKQHQAELSDGCKQALVKAMGGSGRGAGSGAVAPAAAPVSEPTAPEPTAPAPAPSKPAPQAPTSSAARHGAAASAGSGSYLLLKKAQITTTTDDHPGEAPWPAIEMLIPSTWDFKGAVRMYGGKTGCFSESFSVIWEAKSPDGATKFAGIPNYAWQYSDDPQELHNLTDPNRRTHTGGKTNDLCAVAKPLSAEQYFRQRVLNDLKPAMTVESVEPYPALEQTRAPAQWIAAGGLRQRRRPHRRDPRTARVSNGRQADGALVLPGARDPDLSRRSRISLRYPRRRPSGAGRAQGQARWQRKAVQGGDEFHSTHASLYRLFEQMDCQLLPNPSPERGQNGPDPG